MSEQTSPENGPYFGQCLCGEIKYRVDYFEQHMAHCHCSMCRKFHGAAFATFGEVKQENFRWLQGEHLLREYLANNGSIRQFCQQCGSSMTFSPYAGFAFVEISLGTLDTAISPRPDAHVFVDSKAEWSSICDGLPCYHQGRNSKLL